MAGTRGSNGVLTRIGILDIPSSGVLGGVCADLIAALSTALQEQGVEVVYSRTMLQLGMPVLVFNWYRMFIDGKIPAPLPPNAIIFNLSPVKDAAPGWYDNYLGFLAQAAAVIDYSDRNLQRLGKPNGRRFRWHFGYFPLSSMRYPARNQDMLFFGKLSEYRAQRLRQLVQEGVKLKVLENIWGYERDLQIATSRAVLNIGKFANNTLEVYRLWQTLCLGTPVISEPGVDAGLAQEWAPYVTFVDEISHAGDLEVELVPAAKFRTETSFHNNVRSLLEFIQAT